jgi:hypothetical protein
MRTIEFGIEAADDRGDVTVTFAGVTVVGSSKAAWEQVDDDTFRVRAVKGAVYRFTWTATDAAGNTATDSAEVVVDKER